jgi:hypothetical protein
VDKTELMRQLEAAVDDAMRTGLWGTIGVSFSGDVPVILRKETTTKLGSFQEGRTDRNHATKTSYR